VIFDVGPHSCMRRLDIASSMYATSIVRAQARSGSLAGGYRRATSAVLAKARCIGFRGGSRTASLDPTRRCSGARDVLFPGALRSRIRGGMGVMNRKIGHIPAAQFLTLHSPAFQLPTTMTLQSSPVGHGPADLCRWADNMHSNSNRSSLGIKFMQIR